MKTAHENGLGGFPKRVGGYKDTWRIFEEALWPNMKVVEMQSKKRNSQN